MRPIKDGLSTLKAKYISQKHRAKRRGIGWEFTFEEWVDWWGDDIKNRGNGVNKLQMQRRNDTGPYSPENTYKGYPKDNSRTYRNMHANRKAEKAKRDHELFLDALMALESAPPKDEMGEYDIDWEIRNNGPCNRSTFVADKRK